MICFQAIAFAHALTLDARSLPIRPHNFLINFMLMLAERPQPRKMRQNTLKMPTPGLRAKKNNAVAWQPAAMRQFNPKRRHGNVLTDNLLLFLFFFGAFY
jgi:hypothetical protein